MREFKSSPKLDKEQKYWLKQIRREFPEMKLFSFYDLGVTVAIRRTGSIMGVFAVSIAGEGETKFRPKVGKYHAACRMVDGGQPVVLGTAYDDDDLEGIAHEIAYIVCG